jgi:hypothetical protein
MNKEALEKLYAELPVSIKPGAGNYKYVKTRHILDKLNEVFEGRWSSEIKSFEKIDNEILVWVRVSVVDEVGKTLCSQDGFGSAKLFNKVDLGNIYKSAKSRAIKDAVRNWGLGLSFDSSGFNHETITTETQNVPASFNNAQVPASNNMPATASAPAMPTETTTVGSTPFGPPGADTPPMPQAAPKEQEPVSTGLPSFNAPEVSAGPANATQPLGSPPESNPGYANNSQPFTDNNELTKITHVQQIAIQSQLESKNKTFKDFATEAFTALGKDVSSLPEKIEDMSYTDAMTLASFASN